MTKKIPKILYEAPKLLDVHTGLGQAFGKTACAPGGTNQDKCGNGADNSSGDGCVNGQRNTVGRYCDNGGTNQGLGSTCVGGASNSQGTCAGGMNNVGGSCVGGKKHTG